jgi:hypothetical protein
MKTFNRMTTLLALISGMALNGFAAESRKQISTSTVIGNNVITHFASGLFWKTSITLVNLDTVAAPYTLKFYGDDGAAKAFEFQGLGTMSTVTGTLAVGGSVVIESVPGTVAIETGWVYLDSPNEVSGAAVFRSRPVGQPEQEATVPIESNINQKVILAFDNSQGYVMGVALVNAHSDATATVTATFHDTDGAVIFTDTLTLTARQHVAYEMPQQWPASANRRGTVEFTTTDFRTGISVLGLRFTPDQSFTSFHALYSAFAQ